MQYFYGAFFAEEEIENKLWVSFMFQFAWKNGKH